MTDDDWHSVLDVNLSAALFLRQAACSMNRPHRAAPRSGRIAMADDALRGLAEIATTSCTDWALGIEAR
jgi:hypothetical protein